MDEDMVFNFIKKNGKVTFADLHKEFGKDFEGDIDMSYSKYENMVFWLKMSKNFLDIIQSLMSKYKICLDSCNILIYLTSGELINLPIATKSKNYNKPHWSPITFRVYEKLNLMILN